MNKTGLSILKKGDIVYCKMMGDLYDHAFEVVGIEGDEVIGSLTTEVRVESKNITKTHEVIHIEVFKEGYEKRMDYKVCESHKRN